MAASQLELIVNQIRLLSPDELIKLIKKAAELLEQKQSDLAPMRPDGVTYSFIGIGRSGQKDLERVTALPGKYADSRVDFVDCVIAAMAERLGVTRILTVDRRHFGLFRPANCDYFEIIPA